MIQPPLIYLLIAALIILLLAAAGFIYERRAEQSMLTRNSPPGCRIDLGGYCLHLLCLGEKHPRQPTVVLESGHGDWSASWRKVQPEIARFARVCAYDRGGFGWSDPGQLPRTPFQLVSELHALLHAAGEPGPYLLVGHSLGASFSRLFASLYPDEVAGMVWVDSAHEDMQRYLPFWRPAYWAILAATRLGTVLARLGLIRLISRKQPFAIYPGAVTVEDQALVTAHAIIPKFFTAMTEETIGWYHQPNWEKSLATFGDTPIVMLEAQYTPDPPFGYPRKQWRQYLEGWARIQADLSNLSTNTRRIAVNSGHLIQLEQPELVIQAVKDALAGLDRRV